jgi:serine/threonine protein kinase/tetratricopeptide (TPR) repeat protein
MSKPHTDRNLLFGILALQMDFISRDALVAAMNAWALDKQKPLGEILLVQGALRPDAHALLEALVQKHLELHGNDAERSLAALSSIGPVREELKRVADPEVTVSLAHVSRARQEDADPLATRPPSAGAPTSLGLRFRILRPHARGGLGEVFVARDEELHREVALKEIQGQRADDPQSRARFLLEAEITGGLEHPGIVPVYGLGTYADGRPFYAMRFIKGDTLHDAIRQFHRPGAKRAGAGERSVQLRKLLGRFLDVCNAMEYAHSRGVLHRDLKPGNIMLGRYGETLVVDWGLAKPRGAADPADSSPEGVFRPGSAGDVTPTLPGGAVGTPEYMAPEQAAGRLEQLGPASDVYSLGATLYCLLTGRAPFRGGDVGAVLRQVQRGDFPRPRAAEPSVPAALEAVCLKAMALRPEDRYASPRALADDVERFLADEPVSAYRDPLTVRLTRWGRRHRTAVATAAALLLTATAALAVGLVVVNAEKGRTAQALERSRQAEKSAGEQRQLALRTVRDVVGDINTFLKDRPVQAGLRQALLWRAGVGLKDVARAADTATAIDHETVWVHLDLGDIFLEIEEGGTAEAKGQYETALELARQVAEAHPDSREAQRDVAVAHNKLGDVSLRLGDTRAALEAYRAGLAVSRRLADADPASAEAQRDLAVSHDRLGDVYLRLGDSQAARDAYRDGLAVSQRLADAGTATAQDQRALAIEHNKLGEVYLRLGDSAAAGEEYKKDLEIAQRLADADPTNGQARRDLADSHDRLGELALQRGDGKAALEHDQQALDIRRRLADAEPASARSQRDLYVSHNKLGEVYLALGDDRAARDAYQKGLDISQRLAGADKDSALAQRDLAFSRNRLGEVYRRLGDTKAALDSYQKGLEVSQHLADADTESAEARRDLAVSHQGLGDVYLVLGDNKAALEHYKRVGELCRQLADADPASALAKRDLAVAHDKMGDVSLRLGDGTAAREAYQKGLDISRQLADADPASAQARRDLLIGHFKLGDVAQKSYDLKEAVSWYEKALDVARHFANPEALKPQVAAVEERLRTCRATEQAVADPASALKQPESVRLPALTDAMFVLAKREKQPAKAVAAADLLAANAKGPVELYDAACGYALCAPLADKPETKEKYAARAVALLRQAVARGYKDAAEMKGDTDLDALKKRDDFKKLVADLEAAAKPKDK